MIGGALQGLINGTEQLVLDYEVSTPVPTIMVTGLNGNEDGWYTIIFRSTTGVASFLRPNNDVGSNYGLRSIFASASTPTDRNYQSYGGILLNDTTTSTSDLSIIRLCAKSGMARLATGVLSQRMTGTTVGILDVIGQVWGNTVDNITSLAVTVGSGNHAPGTRLIILKSNNFGGGTPAGLVTTPYSKGSWVRLNRVLIPTATNTFTIRGLDGNRDVAYYLSWEYKGGGPSGSTNITINGDTGSNYGQQYIAGSGSSVVAGKQVVPQIRTSYSASAGYTYTGNALIFAKAGFIRSAIVSGGLSSGATVDSYGTWGSTWSNTTANITQLTFTDPNSGSQILAGSLFNLYALRPNG